MWKHFVIGILLLQGATSQPAEQKPSSQQQAASTHVSPAPGNQGQVEAGNKADAASNNQQTKQDYEAKAFQQVQIFQYWILVVTGIITTVVLVVYTVFSGLQWRQIKKQTKETAKQVEVMQGQLDVIKKQSRIMLGTWQAVKRQAHVMEEGLKQTENTIGLMRGQLTTMQGQLKEMENQSRTNRQYFEMQAAITDPRLRVDVHAEDFDPDKRPIFIVTVTNDGLIAATNVAFEMIVKWFGREESLKDVFDVPAKDTEVQHLVSNGVLTDLQFESFNESAPLIVEGTLSYFPYQREDGYPPQIFCYKYYPWKGDRPRGIPQFTRCSRTNIVNLRIPVPTGETLIITDEKVRAKYGLLRKTPNEPKPGKANDDGEDEGEQAN